ncbi:MAG: hypothetical protein WBN51_12620, partial [Gammaproteobacteria bacterium]
MRLTQGKHGLELDEASKMSKGGVNVSKTIQFLIKYSQTKQLDIQLISISLFFFAGNLTFYRFN